MFSFILGSTSIGVKIDKRKKKMISINVQNEIIIC